MFQLSLLQIPLYIASELMPKPLVLKVDDLEEDPVLLWRCFYYVLSDVLQSNDGIRLIHNSCQFGNQLENLLLPVVTASGILIEQFLYNGECACHPKIVQDPPAGISYMDIYVTQLHQTGALYLLNLSEVVIIKLSQMLQSPQCQQAVVEFAIITQIQQNTLGLIW